MTKKSIILPRTSLDGPASQRMLHLVRDELRAENSSLRLDMKSGFAKIDARLHQIQLLAEDQRQENRIVLEAIRSSLDRHDQAEARLDEIEGFHARIKRLQSET